MSFLKKHRIHNIHAHAHKVNPVSAAVCIYPVMRTAQPCQSRLSARNTEAEFRERVGPEDHFPFFSAFFSFLCFPACIFRKHSYIIISFRFHSARWCNGSTSDSGSFSLGSSPGRAATFSARIHDLSMKRAFLFFSSD